MFLGGCVLAFVGWAHLTSPRGPDFRQTLVRWASATWQGNVTNAGGRNQRIRLIRQRLAAHGFRLVVSRRRTLPPETGGFLVLEFATKTVAIGGGPVPFSATLSDVEAFAESLRDTTAPSCLACAGDGLTAAQCIAGRQLVGWSKLQLSSRAFVSMGSIKTFEVGGEVSRRVQVAIRAALEAAGVEFIAENGGAAGVRLRKDEP